jgi:hypothetical protein
MLNNTKHAFWAGLVITFPFIVLLVCCLEQLSLFHFINMIDKVGEEFDHPSALQNKTYRIFACWSTSVVIR